MIGTRDLLTVIANKRTIYLFLGTSITLFLYAHFFYNRAFFNIEIESNINSSLQIFWAGENETFSEENSVSTRIKKNKTRYQLILGDLGKIKKLRIDPVRSPGIVQIKKVGIHQFGYKRLNFAGKDQLARFVPANDIASTSYTPLGLSITAAGQDAQLETRLASEKNYKYFDLNFLLHAFSIIALLWGIDNVYKKIGEHGWVPFLLTIVLSLVIVMGVFSRYNEHPDEYVHLAAGKYYQSKWLPPEICEPGTENTYSEYGTSRLNEKEISYFISGKISALIGFLPMEDFIRLRLCNILLFAFLIYHYGRRTSDRYFLLPLLLSAQLWYIFSYFNSEAFALAVALLIGHQLTGERSMVKNFFHEEKTRSRFLIEVFTLGILFTSALFIKKNFYLILIYWAVFVLIENYSNILPFVRLYWRKAGVLALTICAMYAAIQTVYMMINGMDQRKKIIECKNKIADYQYKPNTPLESKYPKMYLKRRGYPISHVLENEKWPERIFQSSFGVYGYTKYSANPTYYHIVKFFGILFISYFSLSVLIFSKTKEKILFLVTILFSLSMIAIALWWSWTADVQAQGRYLLPIVPMLSILCFKVKEEIDNFLVFASIACLFVLGLYSFSFIGLSQIIPQI